MNSMVVTVDNKISFITDYDNTNSDDQFQILTASNALMTFKGYSAADNHQYGFLQTLHSLPFM